MNRFPEDDRKAATTEDEHEKASGDEPSDVSENGDSPAGSADCSRPLINWKRNQRPRRITAGIRINRMKKKMGTRVRTREYGKSMKYAARTPAIAPDAPICGMALCGEMAVCVAVAMRPQQEIEHEEPPVSHSVLHVVAEDPQVEHVPQDVEQAPRG